jgi:plastocyanin
MRFPLAASWALVILIPGAVQAQVTIEVGNGGPNFKDLTSNTVSSLEAFAETRIHEGDTVNFVWVSGNHDAVPYFSGAQAVGTTTSVTAATIMASSTWNALSRSATYQCSYHPTRMNGVIHVYEVAQHFNVDGPPPVLSGAPFTVSVTAAGAGNTTDELYAGTVAFSSSDSDPGVALPAGYAFTAADAGTHEFSGVVLKTLGPQTITVSQGAVTGQVAVNVVACAPTRRRFRNASLIGIPRIATATAGPAKPYPSTITVSGLTGSVAQIAVTLRSAAHARPEDVDVLLVDPHGRRMVILSDVPLPAAKAPGTLPSVPGRPPVTLMLSDGLARPQAGGWGVPRVPPTNFDTADTFPEPAPPSPYANPGPAGSATFASVFGGRDPNGPWSLFVVDDRTGANGRIAGGWTLDIVTTCP